MSSFRALKVEKPHWQAARPVAQAEVLERESCLGSDCGSPKIRRWFV